MFWGKRVKGSNEILRAQFETLPILCVLRSGNDRCKPIQGGGPLVQPGWVGESNFFISEYFPGYSFVCSAGKIFESGLGIIPIFHGNRKRSSVKTAIPLLTAHLIKHGTQLNARESRHIYLGHGFVFKIPERQAKGIQHFVCVHYAG